MGLQWSTLGVAIGEPIGALLGLPNEPVDSPRESAASSMALLWKQRQRQAAHGWSANDVTC